MKKLTHLDKKGKARMVDVSSKAVSLRKARAAGFIQVAADVLQLVTQGGIAKGDPLESARLAGILAAKNTAHLIPLCHPLALLHADVQCQLEPQGIAIEATVTAEGKTGVEMEALMAVSVAALTLYDMLKAADRGMVIGKIRLLEKSGGRSGHYVRHGKG
jgi:cyclic pyranopterin phosphate synthase